jgi:LacI family transcriptional regulator
LATLAEVAKRAGVSPGLVSRVLNNKTTTPIPQVTRERILRAAAELRYRPNVLARALVTGRSQTLGVYYPLIADPHFTRILGPVEQKARSLGYHLLLSSDLEGLITGGHVDGVLVVGRPEMPDVARHLSKKPMVFVSARGNPQPSTVVWSDSDGARLAVAHLLHLGHRRIAALLGDLQKPHSQTKVEGFREALQDSDATWYEGEGALAEDQIENGYLLTRELLRKHPAITAICARNDFLAVGAAQAVHEAGIPIPQEISIVGHDDSILARSVYPRLTSVRSPFAEAAVLALDRLHQAVESGEPVFPGVMLPVTLTERDSCAAAPGATMRTMGGDVHGSGSSHQDENKQRIRTRRENVTPVS